MGRGSHETTDRIEMWVEIFKKKEKKKNQSSRAGIGPQQYNRLGKNASDYYCVIREF
jgi:hypothetical protein